MAVYGSGVPAGRVRPGRRRRTGSRPSDVAVEAGRNPTLLETGMLGSTVDAETPFGAAITSVGIDVSFRGRVAGDRGNMARMRSEEDSGWAGIYTARFVGVE